MNNINLDKRNGCVHSKPYLFTILFSLLFLLLQTGMVFAQQAATVDGIVVDEAGVPIIGATVKVKNETIGTTTDMDGKFSLKAPMKSTLVVTYIGYRQAEAKTGVKKFLQIVLKEDINDLDEVVVVGYGTQRRGDLTGSIASIRGEEIPSTATTTVAQALKGQIAGMSFSQTSDQPGAKVSIQIRGAATKAEPLIVIDGIPVQTMWEPDASSELDYRKGEKESVFDNINPDDIQDIQVLKDASATSIYGSRAAGGVILITTKRGTAGRTNVSFKASYTGQWIDKKPEVFGAKDYMRQVNRYQLQQYVYEQNYYPWGNKPLPSEADLLAEFQQKYASEPNKGFIFDPAGIDNFPGGTDWYDEVTRKGQIQKYDLSVSGGSEKTVFRVSLSRMSNKGIAINNTYARTSGSMNIDHTFNNWIKGGVSASYSSVNSSDVALEGSSGTTVLFQAARGYDPTVPARDIDGNWSNPVMMKGIKGISPLSILDVTMDTQKESLLTTGYLELKPIKDLTVLGTLGYDRKFGKTGSHFASTTIQGADYDGIAQINRTDLSNMYVNMRATYNKVFAEDHSLSVMLGWEYQHQNSESLLGWNTGFPYDGVLWHNLGLGTNERPRVGSSKNTSQSASFLGRLNYSYKGRYLLTANFRRDGSSNFAPDKQWGNFGGVALAWRISDEEWLKNINWIYNLKLRAGYGVTGNAGSLTGTLTYYKSESAYGYYFNNKPNSGVRLAVIGNPNLSWESQYDKNIGLDFGLFDNRFGGSIDVYERTIKNRIGNKSLMSYQEVRELNYNTKRIDKTTGVDLTLYAVPISTADFEWNTRFTLTYYRDKTTKRDPSQVLDIQDAPRYTWNDKWIHLSDGLLQPGEVNPGQLETDRRAGEVKIKDVNGYLRDKMGNKIYDENGRPMYSNMPDGIIDNADLVMKYNNTPIPFSWNNNFRWRDFDLGITMYGKFHQWKGNDKKTGANPETLLSGGNTLVYVKDQYSYDNLDSQVPSFRFWQHGGVGYGDFFIEKAWYIRIDNITLGYTLPKKWIRGVFSSVRFYASMKNIATITPYKGEDPEYNISLYPSTSSFTFGVDIKF